MKHAAPITERPRITDLLDSHRDLLRRHRPIMEELLAVAVKQGLDPSTMSFIVTDTRGDFGNAAIDAEPGVEFVMTADDGTETAVVPLGADGLLVILRDLIPEGVKPVVTRPAGTVAILVVDHQDEPAIVVMPVVELLRRVSC